jgi:hypothetical protein
MSAAEAPRNKTYEYREEITVDEALKIFTGGRGIHALPSPTDKKPIFVMLFGPPGSGKTTALSKVESLTSLNSEDAVIISLDALVESVSSFRSNTAVIGQHALNAKARGNQATINENFKAAAKPYLGIMMAKTNKRPGVVNGAKVAMNLNEIRKEALRISVEAGKNIIYERTAAKDLFEKEIFPLLGEQYRIFVIYPRVSEDVLKVRLAERPFNHLKRNPPFFRVVTPSMAGRFITDSEDYLKRIIQFKQTGRIEGVFILDGDVVTNVQGGSRKTRKYGRARRRQTRR